MYEKMSLVEFHNAMVESGDLAYKYSLDNIDIFNMQLVLRAYGRVHTFSVATSQVELGRKL
jgi:hypothetical protein